MGTFNGWLNELMIHTGYTEVWPRHWFTETKGCKCFLPADGSEESYKAVINGVITRRKWPSKWVTGVMTLLIMVITPFITGWGPPCIYFQKIMLQTTQLNWSASAISTWNLESHGLGISKEGLPSHWSISTKCFLHGNWELDCFLFFSGKFPGMFGTNATFSKHNS